MPPFAYARAHDVDEAVTLLAEVGDEAKLLAGGQSLLPVLAFRLIRPTHVVDVDSLEGLGVLEERDGELELGPLVRHARLEQTDLQGGHRLLSLAARHIGHLPIRTRGTLGGSLAHADPAAELCVAALALDARIVARSSRGEREIELHHFLRGPFTTTLDPDEMIVAVRVAPSAELPHVGFREFAIRSGDFAFASAGVLVGIGDDGAVSGARIVVGAVEPIPRILDGAAETLRGGRLTDGEIEEAARVAARSCDTVSDRAMDATTRRDFVAAVVRDALCDARAAAAS
jgi:carbon-monoxide dehydrogenase medium subunit/6-hydroxypseudooxynicotine dehydrogenase subunit alpha